MLKLGTNYDYESRQFLDSRQGIAETKEDLKNWSIPVPVGFQVCLDGVWYYYDPNVNLPETGHWVSCIEDNISEIDSINPINPDNRSMSLNLGRQLASDLAKSEGDLDELMRQVFPLVIDELKINNEDSITIQPGQNVAISLTWKNKRKGIETSQVDWGEVISPLPNDTGKIGMTYNFYNSSVNLNPQDPGDYTWTITVKYSNKMVATSSISAYSRIKAYYGASGQELTEGSRILSSNLIGMGISSSFDITSGIFPSHNFDCSGRKYPYILIPQIYFNNEYNVVIGDLVNSDIVKTNVRIVNPFGVELPYVAYRTTGKQTGSTIAIEIK
jgi:hypothetical protein